MKCKTWVLIVNTHITYKIILNVIYLYIYIYKKRNKIFKHTPYTNVTKKKKKKKNILSTSTTSQQLRFIRLCFHARHWQTLQLFRKFLRNLVFLSLFLSFPLPIFLSSFSLSRSVLWKLLSLTYLWRHFFISTNNWKLWRKSLLFQLKKGKQKQKQK